MDHLSSNRSLKKLITNNLLLYFVDQQVNAGRKVGFINPIFAQWHKDTRLYCKDIFSYFFS